MVKLTDKYEQSIKTAIDSKNPMNQVEVTKQGTFKPVLNPYNQQPEQTLKPLPKVDFEPLSNFVKSLPKQTEYLTQTMAASGRQLGRTIANIPSALQYAEVELPSSKGFSKENKSYYEQQSDLDLERYKSVKNSMESQYSYEYMPENTKKAYETVVDQIIRRESEGRSFDEQRQLIQELYPNQNIPSFVAKKLMNIDSKEKEYTLKIENAKNNLVEMAIKNADELRAIQEKYKDEPIIEGTKLFGEVMGSIIQMSPYIAASAAGGIGGVALSSIAGTGTMYTTVFTNSMATALSEGATREQATEYAHVSAMIEAGTEMLSGGIPFAPKGLLSSGIQGKIDDVVKVLVKDGTVRKFISTGVDVFGEGAEEALAEYLGSMAMTIYKEDERTEEELNQDMLKAFMMGALTSATMQMGKVAVVKAAEKFVAEKAVDVQTIDIEQANKIMNNIALRTKVKATDGLAYRLEEMPKGQNGYIINGEEIVLNKSQVEEDGLIESALPHEMVHALEKVKGYDKLANFVIANKLQTLNIDLETLRQAYQEKFNEVHEQALANGNESHVLEIATIDKMARELVADFIKENIASRPVKDAQGNIKFDDKGNILTYRNYDALLRLASNQPNTMDKIKKVIRNMIRKGQIAEALEFDQDTKAQYLTTQAYLESLDDYLGQVLNNADKGLFDDYAVIDEITYNMDPKVLSKDSEKTYEIARDYTLFSGKEIDPQNLSREDAMDLLKYSNDKGLGFTSIETNDGVVNLPVDVAYSLDAKEEVEALDNVGKSEQNLVAVHNLSEEQLLNTLELGGFPVPSIAILKANQDHNDYGGVSVVFKKDTINPRDSRNKTFASDVYSPVFPTIEYRIDDAKLREFSKEIGSYIDSSIIEENDVQTATEKLSRMDEVKKAFLKSIGNEIEIPKKASQPSDIYFFDETIKNFIIENDLDYKKLVDDKNLRDRYVELIRAYFDKDKKKDSELYRNIVKWQIEKIISKTDFDAKNGIYESDRHVIEFEKDFKIAKGEAITEDDVIAYKKSIDDEISNRSEEFEQYIKNKIEPMYLEKGIRKDVDPFYSDGTRKSWKKLHDPLTLDNVLKALKGDVRDTEGFNYGLGSLRAKVSKQFTSISDIKKNTKLLVEEETFNQVKEEYNQEYLDLLSRAGVYDSSRWGDTFSDSIATFARKGNLTIDALKRELKTDGFKQGIFNDTVLLNDTIKFLEKLKSMPTTYFESKPQRAVGFEEIERVLVPEKASSKLLDKLNENGIPFMTYGEEGRSKIIQNHPEWQFSIETNIVSKLNLNTLIPMIENSKQEAIDYINSISQSVSVDETQKGSLTSYLDRLSNFVRDYNPEMRYDSMGNITTDQEESKFNLRDGNKLKVFYYNENEFNKNAVAYGYIVGSTPLGMTNPQEVYVNLKKPLYDVEKGSMDYLNYELQMTIERVIKHYNSYGNNLVIDTEGLTNLETLKAIGDILGKDKIKDFYKSIKEVAGYDGIEIPSNKQLILFDKEQFGNVKQRASYSEEAIKEFKSITFKKSWNNKSWENYIILTNDFEDNQRTMVLDYNDVIDTFGKDLARTILGNATAQTQTLDMVENIIQKPNTNIEKGAFSVNRDDHGNQLTKKQDEFFAKAEVRQTDGTLKVMYHGSPSIFDEFDYEQLGTNGLIEGTGFYFTDSSLQASRYTGYGEGKLYEVYLNITKSANRETKSIEKEQIKNALAKINELDDGNLLSEFGDVEREGLQNVLNKATTSIHQNANDVEMINDILYLSPLNVESALRIITETTGIDGIKARSVDGVVYVAFYPEQIKSINNPTPTEDRRITYSIDVEYDKNIQSNIDQFGTSDLDNGKFITRDGTVLKDGNFSTGNVLIEPEVNRAVVFENPTQAQREQLLSYFNNALRRDSEYVYLELHDKYGNASYEKYYVVSDFDKAIKKIDDFYNKSLSGEVDSEGRALTTQQSEFLQGSVLRDVDGNLIPVYHGTPNEFTIFSKEQGMIFFAREEKFAKDIGKLRAAQQETKNVFVVEAYLNIKKMFDPSRQSDLDAFDAYLRETYGDELSTKLFMNLDTGLDFDYQEFKEEVKYRADNKTDNWDYLETKEILDFMNKNGYDGLKLYESGKENYAVLNPEQIKKVDNLAPTDSKDIRYSLEQEETSTRRYAESALKASNRKATKSSLNKLIEDGELEYVVVTDKKSLQKAIDTIGDDLDGAYNLFKAGMDSGKRMTKDDLVLGQLVLKKMEKSRRTKEVVGLIQDIAILGTELGQQVQALSLIRRMTPEGKLLTLQRTLNRMKAHYREEGKNVNITIPTEYQEFFVEASARVQELEEQRVELDSLNQELTTVDNLDRIKELEKQIASLEEQIKNNEQFTSTENVDAILDEVKTEIAKQLPVTWKDKLNAWRYMSMLGNLRTNVRNVLGNAGMMPLTFSRDVMSAIAQQAIPQEQRTRAIFATKESKEFALKDYNENLKEILGANKYNMQSEIEQQRTIFKTKILEWMRNKTFDMLEVGDDIFVKKHYTTQLAKYLTARGYDLNTITDTQMEEARLFAIEEARKATFKDDSVVAQTLNQLARKGKVAGVVVESVMPFKKTPINILKRGVEYSPIGLTTGVVQGLTNLKTGKYTTTELIDKISAGLTGTGIALIGAWMYSMGFIEIGYDDDENKRVYGYKNSLGRQTYSIRLGDDSYTIDWIAPAIMPFILGATIQQVLERDSELSLMDAMYAGALDIFDPIFELSMLQGVTDTLRSFGGSGTELVGEAINTMAANYLNQYIPTIVGQIARTIDPIQRSTQADATGPLSKFVETTARKVANKIPFAGAMFNAPVIDVKGEPISASENPFMRAFSNFVNPGYFKEANTVPEDTEILRLYELTKDTNVIPRTAPKSFLFSGETQRLGNKELSQFSETMGTAQYKLLGKFISSLEYKRLTDDQRIEVLSKIYDHAYDMAKDEYLKNKGLEFNDSGYKKIIDAELKGVKIVDYLLAKSAYDKMSGDGKKETFKAFLDQKGYSSSLMEIIGGYKPTSDKLQTKGLKKLK